MRELLAGWEENPHIAGIRQCGFIAGIELQRAPGQPYPWQAQTGQRVCLAARKHGLLTRPILDAIVLMPPLCTSESQLRTAVSALIRAVTETCS